MEYVARYAVKRKDRVKPFEFTLDHKFESYDAPSALNEAREHINSLVKAFGRFDNSPEVDLTNLYEIRHTVTKTEIATDLS